MLSTLCQESSEAQKKNVHFRPYDLVQISPVSCPNTYQIMYEETSQFQCQHLQRQHGKVSMSCQIYCKNSFLDQVLYVIISDTSIGSLKSLHTLLFDKYLDHMLVKFEQNRMVRNIQHFELVGKNGKSFLRKSRRHFRTRSCIKTIVR